ncbi:hypothetical protein JGU66_02240 [Myxococcaceae bacterium JPH2]|nr:hypothetical protein [Myxococcaceae bacterium JPH2]
MTICVPFSTTAPLSTARALVGGTLVVGVLDLLDAFVFFGVQGVSPVRILQSIAAGLLGRASFQGGASTALLGGLLHFFIAFAMVAVYLAASRRLPMLREHPVVCGLGYGLLGYAVMNGVVLPLSAAMPAVYSLPRLINGLFAHAFLVGLPSAWFARAACVPFKGAVSEAATP